MAFCVPGDRWWGVPGEIRPSDLLSKTAEGVPGTVHNGGGEGRCHESGAAAQSLEQEDVDWDEE